MAFFRSLPSLQGSASEPAHTSCPATQHPSVDYRMVCDPGHVAKTKSGVDKDGKEPRCTVSPVIVCKVGRTVSIN